MSLGVKRCNNLSQKWLSPQNCDGVPEYPHLRGLLAAMCSRCLTPHRPGSHFNIFHGHVNGLDVRSSNVGKSHGIVCHLFIGKRSALLTIQCKIRKQNESKHAFVLFCFGFINLRLNVISKAKFKGSFCLDSIVLFR